jgi:hypothetical protein
MTKKFKNQFQTIEEICDQSVGFHSDLGLSLEFIAGGVRDTKCPAKDGPAQQELTLSLWLSSISSFQTK